MRPDPRCPSCDGKVSATAQWCMHCGRDFDSPVDANATDDGGLLDSLSGGDRDDADGRESSDEVISAREDEMDAVRFEGGSDVEESGAPDVSREATPTVGPSTAGAGDSGAGLLASAVGVVVDDLRANEDHRGAVALLVPLLVWSLVGSSSSLSFLPFLGAAALGLYLYTRSTAVETVAAAFSGSGLLVAVFSVLGAVRAVLAGQSGVGWSVGLLLFAFALIAAGVWIDGREF